MEKPSFWMASLIICIDEEDLEGARNPGCCQSRMVILAHLLLNFLMETQWIGILQLKERSLSGIGLHKAGIDSFTQ